MDEQQSRKRHIIDEEDQTKRRRIDDHSIDDHISVEAQTSTLSTVPRKFVYHSRIFRLLHSLKPESYPDPNNTYFLYQILNELKQLISERSLADARNPLLVLCDQDLEHALNRKSIHINQLAPIILMQMGSSPQCTDIELEAYNQQLTNSYPSPAPYIDHYTSYETAKSLHDFMKVMLPIAVQMYTFKYHELMNKILTYVQANRSTMIDNRNPGIIHLEHDPLAKIFDANIIHISQMGQRLSTKLFAKNPEEEMIMLQQMDGLNRAFYFSRKANRLNI